VDWGGRLLALWEAASPTALDPVTLATRGPSAMDGVLAAPQEPFSAHPRLDPGHHGEPRLVNFGLRTGPRSTIRLMEFDAQGQLVHQRQDRLQGFAFLHDFALTPTWAVFLKNALEFNPLPYVLGRRGAAQCLRSRPGGRGEFWLIPRGTGAPVVLPATEGFVFHHVNAWEEGATLVVDSIHYADFPMVDPEEDFRHVAFDQLPPGQLERCTIDLIQGHVERRRLSERCCEFATVHPQHQGRRHRCVWVAVAQRETGNAPLQAIEKLDMETGRRWTWSAAPRGFVSEPVLVPHPHNAAEDAGWILSLVWNSARRANDVVILRAADLQPQAILHLPLAIPHGLHGSWSRRDITPAIP
ncbi:MAG: Apocarotenoid-15,15'-oxygenase, partial [Synechococcus sp. SB0669_bin_7]|nr:Apocarotenoid-15,15'-oxygenase [Synechococcus sp. SB0669_bin_7]